MLIDKRRIPDTHVLVLLSHHQVYMCTLRYDIHTDSKRVIPDTASTMDYQCLSPDPIGRTLLKRSWGGEKRRWPTFMKHRIRLVTAYGPSY